LNAERDSRPRLDRFRVKEGEGAPQRKKRKIGERSDKPKETSKGKVQKLCWWSERVVKRGNPRETAKHIKRGALTKEKSSFEDSAYKKKEREHECEDHA